MLCLSVHDNTKHGQLRAGFRHPSTDIIQDSDLRAISRTQQPPGHGEEHVVDAAVLVPSALRNLRAQTSPQMPKNAKPHS
eukprot:5471454-Pleurochrysis_carterae.AAC.3